MKLDVISSSNKNYERVRNFIAKAYSKRYNGWDNNFDKRFDHQTVCFYIENHGEIVASARLVFDRQNGIDSLSPDLAKTQNFEFREHNIECEGTGLCFQMGYLQPLMLSMFKWLDHQNVNNCLSLYDPKNFQVMNYNNYILEFKPVSQAKVIFEAFKRQNTSGRDEELEPVQWEVGIQNKEDRKKCISNLEGLILKENHFAVKPTY
ncbi:hypothetical protein [Chondrinema litorale]|uniref:hypothetical protein n=1 Tax=Chondrinema litorale TaxID=2994555 RepID=UPI002543D76B|nr:hypothetical protein [Chondrinema litorale]UZR99993.1 hypothetical protein OQ292_39115 [Chondrinema litorale]